MNIWGVNVLPVLDTCAGSGHRRKVRAAPYYMGGRAVDSKHLQKRVKAQRDKFAKNHLTAGMAAAKVLASAQQAGRKKERQMKITDSEKGMAKQAAKLNGIALSEQDLARHTAQIKANTEPEDGEDYGEAFWQAAKQYFAN